MAEKLKSVKITWKDSEEWLSAYVWEHSSPSAYFKDLAIADYKKTHSEQNTNDNSNIFNIVD